MIVLIEKKRKKEEEKEEEEEKNSEKRKKGSNARVELAPLHRHCYSHTARLSLALSKYSTMRIVN